jgi:hypothetical protein
MNKTTSNCTGNRQVIVLASVHPSTHAVGLVRGSDKVLRLREVCARSFNGMRVEAMLCNPTAKDLDRAVYALSVRGVYSQRSISDIRSFIAGAVAMSGGAVSSS